MLFRPFLHYLYSVVAIHNITATFPLSETGLSSLKYPDRINKLILSIICPQSAVNKRMSTAYKSLPIAYFSSFSSAFHGKILTAHSNIYESYNNFRKQMQYFFLKTIKQNVITVAKPLHILKFNNRRKTIVYT